MGKGIVIACSLLYLVLLFLVAYYAEYRLRKGKSLINNAYVYALSLTVYCTAWTFYGSVGRATTNGIEFVAIYLGPTIMTALFWPVLRKIIRITKTQRINSLADFISTRYGKNFSIASVVTVFCMLAVVPYIALQLKAISLSFDILSGGSSSSWGGNTLIITLILALFIALFGTRSVDATEKHEGLVAAIAFESIIKLFAFLSAGIFVTYFVFNGFTDIFDKILKADPATNLFTIGGNSSYTGWLSSILLSMMAILLLPRQFQISVIENVKEEHVRKAVWLMPLYLFVIVLFVLPIAFGGKLLFNGQAIDADTFVLAIPLLFNKPILGMFIFLGGFAAATSMIIVETIAISTMVSNSLVMPLLLASQSYKKSVDPNVSRTILYIRRACILLVLLLAYYYDEYVARFVSLVSIGMISFTAVAQFAPAVFGGIYWKGASKNGALVGIILGFLIWGYTLIIPSLAAAGVMSHDLLLHGLFGIEWLKPNALFGLEGLDPITHACFWSLLFNLGAFVFISVYSSPDPKELYQAELFVDAFRFNAGSDSSVAWRGTAFLPDLKSLLANFIGEERANNLMTNYANRNQIRLEEKADPRLVNFSERILAGVIGSASARIMVSSVTKEEELHIDEVLKMVRESQQMIELNKELRKKSTELTKAGEQLRKANEQLLQIDALKDEFLYTVTHELRTPLTSIRSLTEILHDNPDLEGDQRQEFLSAVVKETERLSHLISQVLNLEKYESGKQKLHRRSFDFREQLNDVVQSVKPLADKTAITISVVAPNSMLLLHADQDLLHQVLVNLLSNAIKFSPENGRITIHVADQESEIRISVQDEGKGIDKELHDLIFDKFFQARNQTLQKPIGSGLGLAICKRIIEMHLGKIWVESEPGKGARFVFILPKFEADSTAFD